MESQRSYNVKVNGQVVLSTVNRPRAEKRQAEAEADGDEAELLITFT